MGFGIPTAERAALEATYEDTAVISRMGTKQVGAIDKMAPTPCIFRHPVCPEQEIRQQPPDCSTAGCGV